MSTITEQARRLAEAKYPKCKSANRIHPDVFKAEGYASAMEEVLPVMQESARQWISVEKDLPDFSQQVLVINKRGIMDLAYIGVDERTTTRPHPLIWMDDLDEGYSWWIFDAWTHWMPLPTSPSNPQAQ